MDLRVENISGPARGEVEKLQYGAGQTKRPE